MGVYRGEMWQVGWSEDGGAFNLPLGIFDAATLPDPVIDWQRWYGFDSTGHRGVGLTFRGPIDLDGSVRDIILLDGRLFTYILGKRTDTGSSAPYTHTIEEAAILPEIDMHAVQREVAGGAGDNILRKYLNGTIGRASIAMAEGRELRLGIDEISFLDIAHNRSGLPKYSVGLSVPSVTIPDLAPFLFSESTLQFFGATVATFRSLSIEMANAIEKRRYLKASAGTPDTLPNAIVPGRRDIRFRGTVEVVDASFFAELIRGMFYTPGRYTGFVIKLTLNRHGSVNDQIVFDLPSGSIGTGIHAAGCFISSAKHNVNSPDPLLRVDLEGFATSMKITVKDAISSYPQ